MERIVHQLVQGSPEWEAFRFQHDGASEIKTVMGLDKKTTRAQLLRMKATGATKEFSAWVQENVLNRGHEIEALARPFAVEFAGVDGFYPATVSIGRLSASSDGLDMPDETAWECKSLNQENGPIVKSGRVPDEHMPQCQQVLMVTGADRLLFTVSDGTRENTHHVWVEPDTDWFDRIRAAWRQFNEDLASYQHQDVEAEPVRKVAPSLPVLVLDFEGAVTVTSNIDAFEAVVQSRIDAVPATFETDQEFDDAKADIKFLKEDVEDALEDALTRFLKKNEPIQIVVDAVRRLQERARNKRLPLTRAVDDQSKTIRIKIKGQYEAEAVSHMDALNARIGKPYMPSIPVDFATAMKGKKTIKSLRDACSQALANFKISASAIADGIQVNMRYAQENASEYGFLFADFKTIVLKATDDFQSTLTSRIATHKLDEARKDQERKDREAAEAKRVEDERIAREAADAIAKAATPAAVAPVAPAAVVTTAPVTVGRRYVSAAPASPSQPAAAPAAQPTLRLGVICDRLGFIINAALVEQIGIEPASRDTRQLPLFHEHQFTDICKALIQHIESVAEMAPA